MLMSFQPGRRLATSAISFSEVGASTKIMSAPASMIGGGAIDGGGEAFDRDGVGARDHHKVGVVQGIAHGFELLHHLGHRHEALVVVMTALLRKGLVLEMKGGDAGALEGARGGLGIERVAVAGIGVGDDRRRNDIHHRSQPLDDRAHRRAARDPARRPSARWRRRWRKSPEIRPARPAAPTARRTRPARPRCAPKSTMSAISSWRARSPSASTSLRRHDTSYAAEGKRRGKSMKRGV